MSRPRFLAEHDFNDHIVRGVLRNEPALEFLRVRELGMEKSSDKEILGYARAQELIVVSHDVNTMAAEAHGRLERGETIQGLFLVHQRTGVAQIIEELVLIWAASEAKEWTNQVWFLTL